MRILGFIFVALLFSSVIVTTDFFLPGEYLTDFLNNHFIETFAALIGFNIAAVIFLIGQLMILEERFQVNFSDTRREIKHNTYFLLTSFIISLLLLIFRPEYLENVSFYLNSTYFIANVLILSVFCLAIFAIYEIIHAVFLLNNSPD